MTDVRRAQDAFPQPALRKSRRAFWLKQLHQWHWISSAVSLVGLLLFTITGFTLNHAAEIEAIPSVSERQAKLPAPLLREIAPDGGPDAKRPVPARIGGWLEENLSIRATGNAEWSTDEIYLPLPRPGGDGWVTIDRNSGAIVTERTDRGWISYLNDLHKGRNAGPVWKWFIDIFAAASLVFALTGLILLQLHARKRPSTWPIVGFGLLVPVLLALFFIH